VVRVEVRDDVSFERNIVEFNQAVYKEYRRPWYKRRYSYHEKPSVLRRKKRKMDQRSNAAVRRGGRPMKLYIGLEAQFRSDGAMAIGR